jgi:nanoRNase/pAp phosphatase (c-di-AMP/oligoRNAs hydrolase)
MIKGNNCTREEALEGLIPNILRSVIGWDIVVSLVKVSEDETVVSILTRREDVYDVSKIATQIGVNGGGHRGAAGITIMRSCEESKKELIKVIEQMCGELLNV